MLMLRRSVLITLAVICPAAVTASAAAAYLVMIKSAETGAEGIVYQAENILFAGIITGCLIAAIFIFLIIRSRNISSELDRLLERNRLSPDSTRDGLLRLGETGQKLNMLYRQIEELNEKRALKISSMDNAAEYLAQQIDKPLVILDVTGQVVQASRGYLNKTKSGRADIIDRSFEGLAEGLQINTILTRLEQRHLPIETGSGKKMIRWIPIYNKENAISYVAAVFPN